MLCQASKRVILWTKLNADVFILLFHVKDGLYFAEGAQIFAMSKNPRTVDATCIF